jgi:hypothetical protein
MKAAQVHSLPTAAQGWMLSILGRSAPQLHMSMRLLYICSKLDWFSLMQAVITELGGGQDNAAAKTTVQHALHGKLHAGMLQILKRL